MVVAQLNTGPVRSPVNAVPILTTARHSGFRRFARPYRMKTFTFNLLPIDIGALGALYFLAALFLSCNFLQKKRS